MPVFRSRGQVPEPNSPAPVLAPGRDVPPSTPPSTRQAFGVMTPHGDRRVNRLLERCGLMHFKDMFRLQGATLEDIAAWSRDPNGPQWFKAYFPDIPAAAAWRLMKMASEHHQDSPEDNPQATNRRHAEPISVVVEMPDADPPFHQSDEEREEGATDEEREEGATDHEELPEPPVQWLLNRDTGCAHPTLDGVSPSCVHKRLRNAEPAGSLLGLQKCEWAKTHHC